MTDLERFVFSFFNVEVMARYLPAVAEGFLLTVELALVVIVTGLALGLALALVRSVQLRPVNWAIVFFVDLFRALPPLVVIVLLYFALPHAGLRLSGYAATWASLSLVLAAFAEEIFWAGILAVHRGQWEAATALNMTRAQALRRIILPQAFVAMIPPWGNLFIELLKATSLVSLITLADLTFKAQTLNQTTFQTIPIFTLVLLMYLAMSLVLSIGMRLIEQRAARGLARGRTA